jgi:hypothetical protein
MNPTLMATHPGRTSDPTSEAAIWTRVIQPERDDLTADAARSILRLTFSEVDRRRIHELTVKNQDDALTPEEKVELENLRHVSFLLDLMHSQARRSLKGKRPTST